MLEPAGLLPRVEVNDLPHPCVVITIGLSASGKTTWSRTHRVPGRIGLDRLRALVGRDEADQDATRRAVRLQTLLLLARGVARRSCCCDDTNTVAEHRRRLTWWAARLRLAAVAVPFPVTLTDAWIRNSTRSPWPGRSPYGSRVPVAVLVEQHQRLGEVTEQGLAEEGFTHLCLPETELSPVEA